MKKTLIAVVCLALTAAVEAAKIKVQSAPDPTYDFATIRTFGWDADGGRVIMARTATDDPAPVKARVDPLIRKFVDAEMAKIGKTLATTGTPDVQFHYYVLVTVDTSDQYMGQFLPTVPYWGLPPFGAATTALEVVTRGSLVLDAMLPGEQDRRRVVWRGIAQSALDQASDDAKRQARIQSAVAELIKRFPLQKQKQK
jgi:Domain of unknown function (DUF4136)